MASLSEIRANVARLGVRDPENPSPEETKLILDAYLKNKSMDTEAFNTYVKSLSAPLKAMFEGFAQFSAHSKDVSKRTIDIIEQAMSILQGELKRNDVSDDDRRAILDHVLRLVNQAREESDKHRSLLYRLAVGMIAVFLFVGGIFLVVFTFGKHPELIEKSFELAALAIGKKATQGA